MGDPTRTAPGCLGLATAILVPGSGCRLVGLVQRTRLIFECTLIRSVGTHHCPVATVSRSRRASSGSVLQQRPHDDSRATSTPEASAAALLVAIAAFGLPARQPEESTNQQAAHDQETDAVEPLP